MTNQGFDTFISPLVSFGNQLGISVDIWRKYEELDKIFYSNSELDSNLVQSLKLKHLTGLVTNYGNAVTCEFLLEDLSLLVLDNTLDAQKFAHFRSKITGYGDLTLNLQIDKQKIIDSLYSDAVPSELKIIFYLFNNSLEEHFSQSLVDIEKELEFIQDCKLVYLIAEKTILLEGKHISVLGGDELFKVASTSVPDRAEFQQHHSIRSKRLENISWQGFNLSYLTPLYFEFEQLDNHSNNVVNILRNLATQLILLFIADRSEAKNDCIASIFNSSNKKIQIKPKLNLDLATNENGKNTRKLFSLFKWIYLLERDSYDRLAIAQITIVESLKSLNEADYYQNFAFKAGVILDDTKYRVKAIVEDKIDNYIQQELKLEDYIINSTKNFEDEISDLIKNISDTITG